MVGLQRRSMFEIWRATQLLTALVATAGLGCHSSSALDSNGRCTASLSSFGCAPTIQAIDDGKAATCGGCDPSSPRADLCCPLVEECDSYLMYRMHGGCGLQDTTCVYDRATGNVVAAQTCTVDSKVYCNGLSECVGGGLDAACPSSAAFAAFCPAADGGADGPATTGEAGARP